MPYITRSLQRRLLDMAISVLKPSKGSLSLWGIAFVGLLLTGIIVAIGVKAATVAFQQIRDVVVP